ncbi:hypothetical protein Hamer_G013575 [Homarus americanus]|uniref:DUF243 domain-containing protein n=1 Tax=Homarus americanus TaxID=6706 RepID=A0A8J5KEB7_HOMAM|nr:hypothetical protein Hamer_G013575 [Homarus americanus]
MHVLVSVFVATAYASPQGYNLRTPSGPRISIGGSGFSTGGSGFISGGSGFSSGGSGSYGGGETRGNCGPGQVRHVDGSCVNPQVTRNLYVYTVPRAAPIVGPRPNVPPPRVEHNVIFIRTPENGPGQEPIVVPPPQTRNVVYVLNKRPEEDQRVIHVPAPEQETPEVFFINYGEGENPTLPTGEDLQSALRSASQGEGDIIGSTGGEIRGDGLIGGGDGSIAIAGGGGSIVSGGGNTSYAVENIR